MKKIIYTIIAAIGVFGASSCSGMLDTESDRLVENPALDQKTDSVSYAYGVMEAMQQLADQYFFQNEMRGEMSAPTSQASTHLQNLASFSAGTENKYDSVYLYYKVINNCNYYLAHRDTSLYTGSTNVVINEYVAMAAFRAWAYLQLTTQYGDVPYVVQPVSTVSEINELTATTDKMTILAEQADYLQTLKNKCSEDQLQVPFYRATVSLGNLNWNSSITKKIVPSKCFVPLNIVLGDLYLELGKYEDAAACYYEYLRYRAKSGTVTNIKNNYSNTRQPQDGYTYEWPIPNTNTNITLTNGQANWDAIFMTSSFEPGAEVVSYIPTAINYLRGRISETPDVFGYDYYGTTGNRVSIYRIWGCPQTTDIQVAPSEKYNTLTDNAPYYYITKDQAIYDAAGTKVYVGASVNIGDGRDNMVSGGRTTATSLYTYVQKPSTGYFYLYRLSTVYLRLAEALNRAGHPDLAFYILKTGLGSNELDKYRATKYVSGTSPFPEKYYFITDDSYQFLHNSKVSLLSTTDSIYFVNDATKSMVGIHFHGAGAVDDGATWMSAYNYKDVVEARIDAERTLFGLSAGSSYTTAEYINAVEELICDEYAMEFAFEGTRFTDLLRIARHKNMSGDFGGSFGDTWLSKKLENNAAGITTQNCYLPFK